MSLADRAKLWPTVWSLHRVDSVTGRFISRAEGGQASALHQSAPQLRDHPGRMDQITGYVSQMVVNPTTRQLEQHMSWNDTAYTARVAPIEQIGRLAR